MILLIENSVRPQKDAGPVDILDANAPVWDNNVNQSIIFSWLSVELEKRVPQRRFCH